MRTTTTTHPPAGRTSSADPTTAVANPRGGRRLGPAGVVVVVLVAFAVGRLTASPGESSSPGDASAEAGFARDMQTHHAQAVQMSMLVRDRTIDPQVRTLAYDIALTQQQQIGQMYAWLQMWGLPQTGPRTPMAWMAEPGDDAMAGHDMGAPSSSEQPPALAGAAGMSGMATAQDLDRLTDLEGRAAEVLYLKLMIAHHRGGVAMAEAVLERTDRPAVSRLAQTMVTSQSAEITAMQDMLRVRKDTP